MHSLDDIDRSLLKLLQQNDKLALAELSELTGIAASTISDRIKRLVRDGLISGFHARVAPEALGLELLAFVLVGWSDARVEPKVLERIEQSPDILECHHITGDWNFLTKVRIRNTRALETFLAEMVKAVPGAQRTDTMIVLSST